MNLKHGLVSRLLLSATLTIVTATWASGKPPGLDDARSQFTFRRYREAIAILQASLGRSPSDARLHYWLARCFYELGDIGNAVVHAESSVRYDSGNSDYHLLLARAYGRQAERSHSFSLARKTRSEFETAIKLNPASIPARRDLADFHLQAPWIVGGHKSEALRQIEAIAALDPVEGHLARASYWRHERKPEKASTEIEQALKLKPRHPEPYFEIADFYADMNDITRMREAVEAVASIGSHDTRLACYQGTVMVMAGEQLDEAENLLKTCLASPRSGGDLSGDVSALIWLGRLYEQLNNREEAVGRFRAALQLDPNSHPAREALERIEDNRKLHPARY